MPSISGSRQIKKSSKKNSKSGSKKNTKKNNMDFSSILNDMDDDKMMNQQNQGYQNMQSQQMQMPTMQMPGMQMPGMQMPGMQMPGMQMPGMMPGMPGMMPGMPAMDPNMGMHMTGASNEVDHLHLQHFVPLNQNLQIDNFGVNPNQLTSEVKPNNQYRGFSNPTPAPAPAPASAPVPQVGGGKMFSAYDAFVNKFM